MGGTYSSPASHPEGHGATSCFIDSNTVCTNASGPEAKHEAHTPGIPAHSTNNTTMLILLVCLLGGPLVFLLLVGVFLKLRARRLTHLLGQVQGPALPPTPSFWEQFQHLLAETTRSIAGFVGRLVKMRF